MSIGLLSAQTTRVTGTVISADDGEPVIGATILVKGTNLGTVTNYDGHFSIDVPTNRTLLTISYVGMLSQDIAVKPTVRVELQTDTQRIDEVVITAMGIKRSEKALGYAATTVANEKLTANRTSDIMSSLAGKVAGVQVSSSSDPGSSNSVIIRGMSSLSGSNQPLYVIDGVPMDNTAKFSDDGLNSAYDFGNGSNAVNPDDVASMTILKGAAATALYGNRAANGVIIITTKTGEIHKNGIGIEYNGGVQGETVLRYPEMQNDFGMGWSGTHTALENGSWGPRFDGSMQFWGQEYEGVTRQKPYLANKNNLKDFLDTGIRYSNSVSFNNATEKNNYFVSFSQVSDDGILPTSADSYDKYTFSARGGQKIGNLNVSTSINYANQQNNFVTTSQGFSMINSIYQTPRDISLTDMKDLNDPYNTPGYYYTPYGVSNPYYILDTYQNKYKSEKIFGKFQADYDFLNYFKATYRIGLDATNSQHNLGTPNMKALFAGTPNSQGNLEKEEGKVEVTLERRRELTQDFLLNFNMQVNDFAFDAIGGFSVNERYRYYSKSTVTGLNLPTWYNLKNSANTPLVEEYKERRRIMGAFGQAEVSWRNMVYLTITARNDWSSTLPKNNRSFFYPGFTGSFIFTELLPDDIKEILSFGKFRAAYGKTGNDANPYLIYPYYVVGNFNSSGWGEVKFPLKNTNAFSLANTLGNENLSPEITTEYEFGLNLSFFKGRIGLDAAYYDRKSNKQIFTLDMDPSSGYDKQTINLGKISNKGVELLVNLRPIEIKDFTWDVSWNFTKNKSKVISLPEELGGIASLQGLSGGTSMYAIIGEPVGTFKAQVAERDPEGRIVVNSSTGLPEAKKDFEICGDMNYDYEMGISTTLRYKGISLSADLDIRQGGVMYSRTKTLNYFVGNAIQTAYNDRNTFIVPNSVNKITDSSGKVSYVENSTPVSSADICEYWNRGAEDMGSYSLVDKSFIKLRSIVIGYDLPRKWLSNTFLEAVKVSAFGTNLFVWTPSSNTFIDPEMTSFGNDLKGKFGEYTANPSTRKFGFNLMVKF